MIMRRRHIQSINASILGGVMRAPYVLAPFVFDGAALLCDLPLGTTGFGLLLLVSRGAFTLRPGRTTFSPSVEGDLFGKFAVLFF